MTHDQGRTADPREVVLVCRRTQRGERRYAATTHIAAHDTAIPGDGRRYDPGDGRSVYLGVEAKLAH